MKKTLCINSFYHFISLLIFSTRPDFEERHLSSADLIIRPRLVMLIDEYDSSY